MTNDLDEFDFAAVFSAPLLPGQTLAGRRDREKKKLSRADRLALQKTGRTKQLNLKVRQDLRDELISTASMRDKLPTEIIEVAWGLYKVAQETGLLAIANDQRRPPEELLRAAIGLYMATEGLQP